MDGKTWIYLCSGCEIGECANMEELASTLTSEYKPEGCLVHPCLCNEEGVAKIAEDIKDEPACNVVIGACSKRVNTDIFTFHADTFVERASLRELMAWRKGPEEEEEDTQMLAVDIMRMGVVKARKASVPEPFIGTLSNSSVLIVGGGVTGMKAALDVADAGYEAVLVEKEHILGGAMSNAYRQIPENPPYEELEEIAIHRLIEEIRDHEQIKIFTSAEIQKITGQPGMFDVIVKQSSRDTASVESGASELRVGSIVLATGAKPYDATKLTHLGVGTSPDVVTHEDLEKMAVEGKIVRPSDGEPVKSVAFVQCAGSRDPEHLPYCSTECCMTSLKQALYVRERNPDAQVYVFYKDIRTPGQYENFYRRAQDDEGLFLTKGEVTSVSENGGGALAVQVKNALLGEDVQVEADLVVLATGMVPSTLDSEILKLNYRLGEDLPVDKYGFPNSHFICFPYETRRTGIYAAGCVRQPMDGKTAAADATGAALKAIQCIEMTSRGAATHPRSGDLSFPDFYLQRCTQCKRCTEECPFGSLDEDAKGTPLPNPNRCRRCGICMGACPERIVNFADYGIDMIGSMIKEVEIPDEFEEKPRVLVLVCENDAFPAFDIAARRRLPYDPNVRIIPVRCLGSVNVVWIKDALAAGYDGILMIGCKYGDDYQCHFITGSELLNTRSENIQEALDSMALEPERVKLEQLALTEYERIPEIIGEFMETIEEVGFNPFKGM